ncbi:hypothetical protein B0T17DRAFT_591139 [Bombardia bombarda]|uniref:Rhodopsin domain-containing protein n=1 Tax=Bombardia bombarda TaxID=252184 RepID=A0AA39WTC6_9PEZI|nr:hypothetical protein B0T17DRAFT_591139 [Bombardia bombarda]
MDAASLLALPSVPAPTGLQIFALFVNFFFPALALAVVATRAAGRLATNQFGWDDWLVCIAMLMSVAETVISFFFIKTNFIGIPSSQVPPHDPTQGLIWSYAVQILYNPILALVKSSVLIFLSRLFGQKDGVRRFLLWLNVANISQMVGVFFAIMLQCLPIAFNWDFTIRGGRCVDRRILYTCTAVINIVTDLLVLGLPLWIFTSLKIPKRTKFALLFVFLLGFLVTITSIVRLVLLIQGLFGITITSDMSGIGFITSAIETNLALITASAPALRPIFRSRERGGWFPRSLVAPSRIADEETGKMPIGWGGQPPVPPPSAGTWSSGKSGRGGSRGGKRGGNSSSRTARSSTKSGRGGKIRPIIRVRTDLAELRSQSPRSSEEETMTNNGIMRVSDIQREIDGIVKDIAVSGSGTYTGTPITPPVLRPSIEMIRPRTGGSNTSTPPRPVISRPSFDDMARPRTGTSARRYYPERYYSESVYPDQDYDDQSNRDYNDERMSRYGERRFGVVTPKGTTPTSRAWKESGRPF